MCANIFVLWGLQNNVGLEEQLLDNNKQTVKLSKCYY